MSMEKTRLSNRAQPKREEAGLACASIPCWRGVGDSPSQLAERWRKVAVYPDSYESDRAFGIIFNY
jgi:hypothetical protein